MTRHVHPNAGPRQTAIGFPLHTDQPLAPVFGYKVQNLHPIPPFCQRLLKLSTKEKEETCEKINNLHLFSEHLSSMVIIWAEMTVLVGQEATEGAVGLSQKSGVKEPDCFNLSARGAPLFIKLFGCVIQTRAPMFSAPPLFSHENQFP